MKAPVVKLSLNHPFVLYFVLMVALANLLYLSVGGNMAFAAVFLLVGFLTSFFSKNMTAILVIAIVATNVLQFGSGIRVSEGLENKKDDDEPFTEGKDDDEGFSEGNEDEKKDDEKKEKKGGDKKDDKKSDDKKDEKKTEEGMHADKADAAIDRISEKQKKITEKIEKIEPMVKQVESFMNNLEKFSNYSK
jgi:hypothetical protein